MKRRIMPGKKALLVFLIAAMVVSSVVAGCGKQAANVAATRTVADMAGKTEPRFAHLPDAGSFDNVNVEEIVKLHPDVVLASVTSALGNKAIANAGIPVVTLCTGLATTPGLENHAGFAAPHQRRPLVGPDLDHGRRRQGPEEEYRGVENRPMVTDTRGTGGEDGKL